MSPFYLKSIATFVDSFMTFFSDLCKNSLFKRIIVSFGGRALFLN